MTARNHYEVLSLSGPTSHYDAKDIKIAYKRALLRHHPDKNQNRRSVSSDGIGRGNGNSNISNTVAGASELGRNEHQQQHHSIDEISQAYKVLSNAASRAEYDREQALLQSQSRQSRLQGGHHTRTEPNPGLETVDLDEMEMAEEEVEQEPPQNPHGHGPETTNVSAAEHAPALIWTRQCRCGKTYRVTETQLEKEASAGELYVPCEGCSLWLRVLFQVSAE